MKRSFFYRPVLSGKLGDGNEGSRFGRTTLKVVLLRGQGSEHLISNCILQARQPSPYPSPKGRGDRQRIHNGYTLVEILVATALTLLLLGVVVRMFGSLGQSITDSRAILEASDHLRSAAARLQMDLQGVTVTMLPPRNPDDGEGYFEYIEGPVWQGYDWNDQSI